MTWLCSLKLFQMLYPSFQHSHFKKILHVVFLSSDFLHVLACIYKFWVFYHCELFAKTRGIGRVSFINFLSHENKWTCTQTLLRETIHRNVFSGMHLIVSSLLQILERTVLQTLNIDVFHKPENIRFDSQLKQEVKFMFSLTKASIFAHCLCQGEVGWCLPIFLRA